MVGTVEEFLVGNFDGWIVGSWVGLVLVGVEVGSTAEGVFVWSNAVGDADRFKIGRSDGIHMGLWVGKKLGAFDGLKLGESVVGSCEGNSVVGEFVGS